MSRFGVVAAQVWAAGPRFAANRGRWLLRILDVKSAATAPDTERAQPGAAAETWPRA